MRHSTGVADVPSMCAVYFSAFSDTAIGQSVFPPTSEAARQFWAHSLTDEVVDPNAAFLVMTTTPSNQGGNNTGDQEQKEEVIGFAKWVRPGAPIETPPPAEAWPQDGNPTLAVEFFGALTEAHKRVMGDRPHWYLELIGVRKEWMGKGVASAMMRWGVERADEDGLPCFLEATPEGRGMYEKYGFRVLDQQEFDTEHGKVLEYFMIRDAQTGSKRKKGTTTMCKCEFYRYDCGHETKAGYTNCQTGQAMADSSESCGTIDFAPVRRRGWRCDNEDCKFVEAMRVGWTCCKCNKGPNTKAKCEQDTASFFRDWKDCGHMFCETCSLCEKKTEGKGKNRAS
ncbi:acyl-CoA N-acyltransferase [Mariannaea sp. PMI_226]|nr:acyl-CoA N-acyltransferase [Mariannaea sp. PMI_226]